MTFYDQTFHLIFWHRLNFVSLLSCSFNNSKLTWYLTSQCRHTCGHAESRQPDLEVKNTGSHLNQAEVV